MATILTSHYHQQRHQFPGIDNIKEQQLHQQQQQNFCKDCDVMFESSTSLEVHLSYHKENLLTRWAVQDNSNNNSSMDVGKTHDHSIQVIQQRENSTSSSTPQQHQQYFAEPHYLTPQYNNNTGDHSMEPTYRPFGQHHVVDPSILYNTHHGGGLLQSSPYLPQGHIFSPNSSSPVTTSANSLDSRHHVNSAQHHSQQQQQPPTSTNNSTTPPVSAAKEPAEILDLDSHKVHLYQHQQQQHLPERNFFHRPYLAHLLPPQPGINGWPSEHHFVNNNNTPTGFGEHQSLPPGALYSSNGPTAIVYDLIRLENPNGTYHHPQQQQQQHATSEQQQPPPGSIPYSPASHHHLIQQQHQNSQAQQPPPSAFPPNSAGFPIKNESLSSNSPASSPIPNQHRSANTPDSVNPGSKSAPPKTKGWKGGECKRPKTYNCVACNKWFTSSGHLKRHYGTTLHKNSVKQKGGEPIDEPPPKMAKGKRNNNNNNNNNNNTNSNSNGSNNLLTQNSSEISIAETAAEIARGGNPIPSSPRSDSSSGSINNVTIKQEDVRDNKSYGAPISQQQQQPLIRDDVKPFLFGHERAPNPVPSPNSHFAGQQPPYLPYGNAPPLATSNSHQHNIVQVQQQAYGQQFHPMSHPPVPFSNGFAPDTLGPLVNGPGQQQHYSVPSPIVPTTIYSGNGSYNVNGPGDTGLPPFSSFSHYDQQQNSYPHVNPNNVPSPFSTSNRVTPPYHQQQQQSARPQQQTSPHHHSGRNSNNSGNGGNHMDSSFESNNGNEDHTNRGGSPEEARSATSITGSLEGSLDGLDNSVSGSDSPNSLNSESSAKDRETGGLQKCPHCSKTFGRVCYLTQHANSSHSAMGKPHKCHTCGKRFGEHEALDTHLKKHNDEKPYKCVLCPKQFNHKTDLRRHVCLHTGEKPFICNLCGKGFIRKDHMTKHVETHRKQKNTPTS